eukprot:6524600-Prymnesium_polylepis.2
MKQFWMSTRRNASCSCSRAHVGDTAAVPPSQVTAAATSTPSRMKTHTATLHFLQSSVQSSYSSPPRVFSRTIPLSPN